MKVKDIYNIIDSAAMFDMSEEWDNSGILIGSGEAEVHKILVALDCSFAVAKEAAEKGCDLIVSHHPLIFSPLYSIDSSSVAAFLIRNNISLISAHTNIDKAEMGTSAFAAKALGLSDCSQSGFWVLGETKETNAKSLAEKCKKVFSCEKIRYTERENIKKVAVVAGSGSSFLKEAAEKGADALITGDVKHDAFIEAKSLNIALIDAGHYETEKIYMPCLLKLLKEKNDFLSIEKNLQKINSKTF